MKRAEGLLVLISLFYANVRGFGLGSNKLAGPYYVKLNSISALDPSETPGTKIKYDIEKIKLGRYSEGVQGCIHITEPVTGPIAAHMKCMKDSDSGTGLMNYMLDKATAADNICEAEQYSKFMEKFKPNLFDDDCGFKKGKTCLDPPFDMNKVLHEYLNDTMYGIYAYRLWFEAGGKPIFGYDIVLNFMKPEHSGSTIEFGMNMLEIPVKLIVKAPNQQVEDQTIHCNLSWTIKRLKGYLSEVYPSKPNTEDQRLIYYGQLLNDSVTLKDVFTRYEAGEETHTVHLVCMPSKETLKMQARKMAEENANRARNSSQPVNERLTPPERENPLDQERENAEARNNSPAGYQQWINGLYPQSPDAYNYMQQWAWMQHAYANYYMNQYMDMVARQNGIAFREGYADPRQREPVRNPEPQPAHDVEDDDNRINRDWLDYFYTLSRLLVLFSIVYFYSSPARFIIVSALGFIMYLYQVGFFRLNQLQGLENNNEVLNNNVPPENNNVMPQGEAPGGAAAAERTPEDVPQNNQNQENGAEPPERPSFIALTWTFVTSFFASMIPETQNPL